MIRQLEPSFAYDANNIKFIYYLLLAMCRVNQMQYKLFASAKNSYLQNELNSFKR